MRHQLQPLCGTRQTFSARFTGYGNRYVGGTRGIPFARTVLLHDVRDEQGEVAAGHAWVNDAEPFRRIRCAQHDRVEFSAEVEAYEKGFTGHSLPMLNRKRTDYRLAEIRDVRIVERAPEPVPHEIG